MIKEEAIHIIENVNANTNCDNCFYKYDATCEDCRVETALNMAIEALANQKSIIEELEKIKKEILKHYCTICWVDLRVCKQKYHCETCKGFAEIIDKHISELKGENK